MARKVAVTWIWPNSSATKARAAAWAQDSATGIRHLRSPRTPALLRGRGHVEPDDIRDLAPDVLRHRIVLSADAQLDGRRIDDLLRGILEATAAPRT